MSDPCRQFPELFEFDAQITLNDATWNQYINVSMSITINSTGSWGFYIVGDSGLKYTYNLTRSGSMCSDDGPGHLWSVSMGIMMMPENTLATRQNYQVTYSLHCDDYDGHDPDGILMGVVPNPLYHDWAEWRVPRSGGQPVWCAGNGGAWDFLQDESVHWTRETFYELNYFFGGNDVNDYYHTGPIHTISDCFQQTIMIEMN